MKAFDYDLISFSVLDASSCIESRASPWDNYYCTVVAGFSICTFETLDSHSPPP